MCLCGLLPAARSLILRRPVALAPSHTLESITSPGVLQLADLVWVLIILFSLLKLFVSSSYASVFAGWLVCFKGILNKIQDEHRGSLVNGSPRTAASWSISNQDPDLA